MVFEERLKLLNKLIDKKNKLNNTLLEQISGEEISYKNIVKLQQPITNKLDETNLKIENLNQYQSYQKFLEHTSNNLIEPFKIIDKSINNFISKSSTIKPIFSTKYVKDKEFEVIKINGKDHIVYKNKYDNKTYIFNHDIAPEKYINYEYTDDLDKIIRGFGSDVDNKEDVENYLQIFQTVKGNTNSNYYKLLINKLKSYNFPIVQGNGLKFISSNPIELFIKLRKLIAAKRAGHDNVNDEINQILDYLLKKKLISICTHNKWMKKILKN